MKLSEHFYNLSQYDVTHKGTTNIPQAAGQSPSWSESLPFLSIGSFPSSLHLHSLSTSVFSSFPNNNNISLVCIF
jgi:hypothetical protein